jgi:perosamine synthetase
MERREWEACLAGRGAIESLERTVAEALGVPWAVSVASGTLALYFALRAAGVRAGDEVILPAFDWFAATAAVLHCDAVPCYADVSRATYTLSPHAVARCRTARTRAVIATHLFGNPCDMPALRRWCDRHQIALIEDLSQAMGATCAGRPVGAWGDLACLSLTFSKPLTSGEGGLILTPHAHLYERLLTLCAHPLRQYYAGLEPDPFSLRAPLNPLGVELFRKSWAQLPIQLQQRQRALQEWNARLAQIGVPLLPVQVQRNATHALLYYCPLVPPGHSPAQVVATLQSHGILARVGSPAHYLPLALRRALQAGHWRHHPDVANLFHASRARCPNARQLASNLLTVDI